MGESRVNEVLEGNLKPAGRRLVDCERALAVAYAPADCREQLELLWAFDERLGRIVADTSEPAIGEMRLLWWREAIGNLDSTVPAEPLLEAIASMRAEMSVPTKEWGALAEGWHALLQRPIDDADLERFGRERGGRLFRLSAALLGGRIAGLERAGAGWALCDLAASSTDEKLSEAAAAAARTNLAGFDEPKWPLTLRPLGALTVIAGRDLRRGPRARRQGSPGRVARMAWHRLTGR